MNYKGNPEGLREEYEMGNNMTFEEYQELYEKHVYYSGLSMEEYEKYFAVVNHVWAVSGRLWMNLVAFEEYLATFEAGREFLEMENYLHILKKVTKWSGCGWNGQLETKECVVLKYKEQYPVSGKERRACAVEFRRKAIFKEQEHESEEE